MSVHSVSKCGKRPQNEDKHNIIVNINNTNNNDSYCSNCGYNGHLFKDCYEPVN